MNTVMTVKMPTVAVTGATGFLGSHLCKEILSRGFGLIAVSRRSGVLEDDSGRCPALPRVPVIGAGDNLVNLTSGLLAGVDVVIHCAARVHQLHEENLGENALREAYLAANVNAALQAARAACAAGARRFVFVSSVHVHARETAPGEVLSAGSPCHPQSHYACSKYRAEQALKEFCRTTNLELVIVRPPLVYGAGVKAKFAQLANWVASGRPLPFGALRRNRRSFVSVGNLVDFLLCAAVHEKAAGRAWLVSDGEAVSTAGLIELLSEACGRRTRNWYVPPALLRLGLALIGRSGVLSVLDGSLAVDIEENRKILGWEPVETMQQALPRIFAVPGTVAGQTQRMCASPGSCERKSQL